MLVKTIIRTFLIASISVGGMYEAPLFAARGGGHSGGGYGRGSNPSGFGYSPSMYYSNNRAGYNGSNFAGTSPALNASNLASGNNNTAYNSAAANSGVSNPNSFSSTVPGNSPTGYFYPNYGNSNNGYAGSALNAGKGYGYGTNSYLYNGLGYNNGQGYFAPGYRQGLNNINATGMNPNYGYNSSGGYPSNSYPYNTPYYNNPAYSPYSGFYGGGYPSAGIGYDTTSFSYPQVVNPQAVVNQVVPQQQLAPQALPAIAQDSSWTNESVKYYSDAKSEFSQGNYENALRLAGHAALESPNNPKIHELVSLSLFAMNNYPAAASEAHAAIASGNIAQWGDLYAYYDDNSKYTTQLRALEKASTRNPRSAAERFLLGYHYLMLGSKGTAKREFAEAVKLTPTDQLADHVLQALNSNKPITPPEVTSVPKGKVY
jgi:hypothetical protein